MKKNFLALVLCASMLTTVALGGCANTQKPNGDNSKNNSVEDSSATDGKEMVGNMYVEGLPIVKDSQAFKIAVMGHAMDQTPFEKKQCVIEAEKETNVKISWVPIPANDGSEKINLMLSGGDLPDAFMNAGLSDLMLVTNIPQFHALGEYIDKYAPNIKSIYTEYPEIPKILEQSDGNMYSVMTGQMTNNDTTSGLTYINRKWLDKLGLKAPTTTDELYTVLKAFKESDPNGNGKADEIPMAFCESVWATFFEKYLAPFGIYRAGLRNETVIRDGKVVFSKSLPEFRTALEFYNKLAQEGLLDIEGFSQSEQQYAAKGTEGRYGVYLDYYPIYNAGEEFAADYEVLLPLKGPDGYQVHDGNTMAVKGTKSGFAITKSCKTPEVLIRWVDYINSDFDKKMSWEYGEKAVGWEGTPDEWWVVDNGTYPDGMDYTTYKFSFAAASRIPSLLTQKEMRAMIYPDKTSVSAKRLEQVIQVEPFYPKENYQNLYEDADVSAKRGKLAVEITAHVSTFTADAVVNGITDKKWEEYLSVLEQLKVDEYTAMWQTYYDKTK